MFSDYLGRYIRLSSSPFQISESYQNQITSGVPLFTFPNPFLSSLAEAAVASQRVTAYQQDVKNGNIRQWKITLERQYKDIGLRLSYVGSHTYNLNDSVGSNKPPARLP